MSVGLISDGSLNVWHVGHCLCGFGTANLLVLAELLGPKPFKHASQLRAGGGPI